MDSLPDPLSLLATILTISMVPFLAVMGSSFIKLTIVFALLRNALGVQQIPPNLALYGLSMILTMYIMAPIGMEVFDYVEKNNITIGDPNDLPQLFDEGLKPYRNFLYRYSHDDEYRFFTEKTKQLWPEKYINKIGNDSLIILLPAFIITEITRGFEIGFLIYLPFIVIDLIISNILLSMGMMMMSPITISLPFKLLLFVLLDGWTKLTHGLIGTYT